MPPRSDIPPAALLRWDDLIARIRLGNGFEPFLDDLADRLPLPSGGKRQKSRILEWFSKTLPSAPYALEIIATARRHRLISKKDIDNLFS